MTTYSTSTRPTRSSLSMLRAVLTTNAVTSAVGGLVALVAAGPLDEHVLGTGSPGWVRAGGAGLVLFAAVVASIARADAATVRRLAPWVSVGDAAWVAFTIASIAAGWYSATGNVVMGVVGAGVAVFGAEQVVLARRAA